jgi:hypothetical protein
MNYRILNIPLVLLAAFLLGAGISTDSYSQKKDNLGKEFYLAFGPNEGSNDSENLFALYITGPVSATGYVEVPAIGFRQNFTVIPGQIQTIDLPNGRVFGDPTVEITELQAETIVRGMAVHVVADTEIAVYGMNHKMFSSDAFMALPIDVLGTEYRTMNYQSSLVDVGGQSNNIPGQFWVVAIFDSTNITMSLNARSANGKPAKTPFSILLNKGDVYLIQVDPDQRGNDLTGSHIESDLPLAVFTGHMRAGIPEGYNNVGSKRPSRDHLVEQLPPISSWGDSALVIPYSTSDNPDVVRIVSAEDTNTITVNGVVVATLNAGQFYEIKQLAIPTAISATNPILVGQYMHTSVYGINQGPGDPEPYGDPALALVYPVEQFTTGYTFISIVDQTAFTGNFINIVVEQSGVTGLLLDGVQVPPASFNAVPGSTYVYAQVRLAQGTHNITGPKPFGITVYALGNVDSYAYTGGTLLKTITPFKTDDIVIDFGDRPLNQRDWSGMWDSVVSLQNISADPLTIFYFQRRTGDTSNFLVTAPKPPHLIPAFVTDSMTLRFNPLGVPNIRRRTTINAKTEHLRAYVVDVYGRGVVGLPMSYSDSATKTKVDTIYFGIHGENSPPIDRSFYLGNTGTAALNVHSYSISGPNAADFSVVSSEDGALNPLSLPFTIGLNSAKPIKVTVRFTPGTPRAPRVAYLDINDSDKVDRRVVLLAIVDTVTIASVTPVAFDTLYICDEQDKSIRFTNNNTFSVTLERIVLSGSQEFIILDQLPLVIPPNSSRNVRIRFAPNSPGIFTATLTSYFDLPTGATQTLGLSAVGLEPEPFFWAPRNIHILAEEEVLYPIYARVDLARMVSKTYTVEINYDPTHLTDIDVVQDNTLSLYGYFMIDGYELGSRKYTFETVDGSIMRGGGPEETRPLLFIKFKSSLNGEDRLTIHDAVDINYTVTFKNSPLPVYCQAQSTLPGRITIDSSCADVHIVKRLPDPFATYIHQPTPNPASNGYIDAKFDVPTETAVKLVLVDALGQIAGEVVNEVRQQGRYTAHISTAGLANGIYTLRLEAAGVVKFRKVIVSK